MHKFSKFVFSDTQVRVTFSNTKIKHFWIRCKFFLLCLYLLFLERFIIHYESFWPLLNGISYKDKTFLDTMQVFSEKYFWDELTRSRVHPTFCSTHFLLKEKSRVNSAFVSIWGWLNFLLHPTFCSTRLFVILWDAVITPLFLVNCYL